jgi:LPXTG-motif cell wall-anchored protein
MTGTTEMQIVAGVLALFVLAIIIYRRKKVSN